MLSDSIGVLTVVPAAGLTHAASGIGEAFLDGVPMLVISGGPRTDTEHRYRLHQMDTHKFAGVALATGAAYLPMNDNAGIAEVIAKANAIAAGGRPVIVGVRIDYSKRTCLDRGRGQDQLRPLPAQR